MIAPNLSDLSGAYRHGNVKQENHELQRVKVSGSEGKKIRGSASQQEQTLNPGTTKNTFQKLK